MLAENYGLYFIRATEGEEEHRRVLGLIQMLEQNPNDDSIDMDEYYHCYDELLDCKLLMNDKLYELHLDEDIWAYES
jgi:hypothetical protein